MSIYYITNESIDNFKETNHLICVGIENKVLTEEEKKEQFKEELYKDTTIFESESPFIGYPIRENNTIRPATVIELLEMGYLELEDGEYIEGKEIKKIDRPSYKYDWNSEINKWIPNEKKLTDGEYIEDDTIKFIRYDESLEYLKPVWNKELHIWEEGATELEKTYEEYSKYKFLDTPLSFEDMEEAGVLEDYKEYMKSCKSAFSIKMIDDEEEYPKPSEKLNDYFNSLSNLFKRG